MPVFEGHEGKEKSQGGALAFFFNVQMGKWANLQMFHPLLDSYV